jgi:SAM-dependent methyltransferase
MSQPEFDQYAGTYEELLKDPIRDRFGGGSSGFFHLRRRDLIRTFFRQHGINTTGLSYLDLGCGKGELLTLLRSDFARLAGCDPSAEMLESTKGVDKRQQHEPEKIPFDDAEFDLVTAAGVFHHVPPASRLALAREVARVLKPGGVFAVMEHNPYNPATRLIVSRTPVDANAILLRQRETRELVQSAGLEVSTACYFLFFPEFAYRHTGDAVEGWLRGFPLGGQYAVFGRNPN